MIGELILGRTTGKSVVLSLSELKGSSESSILNKYKPYVGYFSLAICLFVLSYFSVISGWVLNYLAQFAFGLVNPNGFEAASILDIIRDNGWLQVLLMSAHLAIVVFVVTKEYEDGVEKAIGVIMPLFLVVLTALLVNSLSLDSTKEALRFFFYPDFSRLNINSLAQALGHVMFTLSLGFGLLVTFGNYLRKGSYIPITGFRVASVDSSISIIAGMLIFPLVLAAPRVAMGPEMLFETVPVFFGQIPGGTLLGLGFFLCLYLGALSASLGLLETVVANLVEADKVSRNRASWSAGGLCFMLAIFPALSSSLFSGFQVGGQSLLEFVDNFLINWILPIVGVLISQVILYYIPKETQEKEFEEQANPDAKAMYKQWVFVLKWVVPIITVTALGMQTIGLFLD